MTPEPTDFLAERTDGPSLLGLVGKLGPDALKTFAWPYLIPAVLAVLAVLVFCSWMAAAWAFVAAIGGFVALAAALYLKLRALEKSDRAQDRAPDYAVLSNVMAIENDGLVNHLAGISKMKPGRLRRLTLRIAFWTIGSMARVKFRPGFLGALGTIHSARWIMVPGTDKLLFFSNYGGSWESYLEDFITKAASGLTSVWSNTEDYPRTRNLFFDGATDGDRFKRWARRQQRPSYFWYRAYPNLTTHSVRRNAAIRDGLIRAKTEDQAEDWLALFGSRPRQPASLDTSEAQALLFGGMGKLRDAHYAFVRLPPDPAAARAWLKSVEGLVSFGDVPPKGAARILAFTATGLGALGLRDDHMTEFPAAFRQGMDDQTRADHVLMDTGEDRPEKWRWGHGEHAVDAALLAYAEAGDRDGENAAAAVAEDVLGPLKAAGGVVVASMDPRRLPESGPVREAFGFVDGVSQPVIRGTARWTKYQGSQHLAEPGEFILGYPDNRGHLPATPTLPAALDRAGLLPPARADVSPRDWPDMAEAGAARDFGRNGPYLVTREMDQDVAAFHRSAEAAAASHAEHPSMPKGLTEAERVRWIKAKTVGRWEDGTSLVRHPDAPGSGWDGAGDAAPDNDFLLGSEDPEGLRCPFGSHIRRANPRESFEPGDMDQLAIVNRHRILRVGRPYGPDYGEGDPGEKRGLLFMCLNADIERQFEFIQQTWAMSNQFHGLTEEVDILIGRGGKGGQISIPGRAGPIFARGFKDLVSVRGGAYFFLPSRSAIRFLSRVGNNPNETA